MITVLRSFGRAVRLEGQQPVVVLAVLSRVRRPNHETERRVVSFLNESGPTPQETLVLDRLLVIPDDLDLAHAERVLLDGASDGSESALGRGYLRLMSELAPADSATRSEMIARQQAVWAMRDRLTSDDPVHATDEAFMFSEDQIDQGVLFAMTGRYVDLVVVHHQHRYPLLVAEYVHDLAESEAWRWWQDRAPRVARIVLFSLDGHELKWRAFRRRRDGERVLHEQHWP